MGDNLGVKVPCGGWQHQPLANGKGVHGDVESEGSPRQNPDPRTTNRGRGRHIRASLQDKAKPNAAKGYGGKRGGCGRKVIALTRGGLPDMPSTQNLSAG